MKHRRARGNSIYRDLLVAIDIADITVPEGRRKIDEEVVERLSESISKIGLLHPVTVVKKGHVAGEYSCKAGKITSPPNTASVRPGVLT